MRLGSFLFQAMAEEIAESVGQGPPRSMAPGEEGQNAPEENSDSESCQVLAKQGQGGDVRHSQADEASHEPAKSAAQHSVPVTSTHVTVANHGHAQFPIFLSILILLLSLLTAAFFKVYLQPPSAYDELRSYAVSQSESMKVESIAELPVDDLNSFAQSTCVEARRAEDIRTSLKANLRIPAEVRDMIIASAVVDGVTTSNSMSNTTSDLASEGRAISFLAFWSTVYSEPTLGGEWYSSCVMAAGITIAVGEDVAEWVTRNDRVVTGSQPCHCGYFACERCPIFHTRETRTPIFKRHKLTLKNQVDLRSFFVALSAFCNLVASFYTEVLTSSLLLTLFPLHVDRMISLCTFL